MVADDGPGIAHGDRSAALKPFIRLPQAQAKDGSGLGLSLVAAIARLHHAQLLLEDNQPGLRARIVLSQDSVKIVRSTRTANEEEEKYHHEPVYP